jgi:hypothetical protein
VVGVSKDRASTIFKVVVFSEVGGSAFPEMSVDIYVTRLLERSKLAQIVRVAKRDKGLLGPSSRISRSCLETDHAMR